MATVHGQLQQIMSSSISQKWIIITLRCLAVVYIDIITDLGIGHIDNQVYHGILPLTVVY